MAGRKIPSFNPDGTQMRIIDALNEVVGILHELTERVEALEEAYVESKLIGTKETEIDEQSPEARK